MYLCLWTVYKSWCYFIRNQITSDCLTGSASSALLLRRSWKDSVSCKCSMWVCGYGTHTHIYLQKLQGIHIFMYMYMYDNMTWCFYIYKTQELRLKPNHWCATHILKPTPKPYHLKLLLVAPSVGVDHSICTWCYINMRTNIHTYLLSWAFPTSDLLVQYSLTDEPPSHWHAPGLIVSDIKI